MREVKFNLEGKIAVDLTMSPEVTEKEELEMFNN